MPAFQILSSEEVSNKIQQNNLMIVDIRDPQTFARGHLPHAQLLNNENLENFLSTTDKQQPLLVCCYHGISSQQAAQFLADKGFAEVYSLSGGFVAWQEAYPQLVEMDNHSKA